MVRIHDTSCHVYVCDQYDDALPSTSSVLLVKKIEVRKFF